MVHISIIFPHHLLSVLPFRSDAQAGLQYVLSTLFQLPENFLLVQCGGEQ